MIRMRKLSLVTLLSLSLAGCSTAPAAAPVEPDATDTSVTVPADQTPAPDKPKPEQKTKVAKRPPVEVLESLTLDLNADGNPDKLVLKQKNGPRSEPLGWVLEINDEPQFEFDTQKLQYTNARIQALDLDSNGVPEILFYRISSGSAGEMGLNVFRHQKGGWWQIFECLQQHYGKVEQTYIGNYQVQFRDEVSGLQAVIPLDPEKYKGFKTDAEREEALKRIRPWVDPISDFLFEDIDNDGVQEIIAVRRVVGIAHADTIARLNTAYKLKKGSYYPLKISLIAEKDKKTLAEKTF